MDEEKLTAAAETIRSRLRLRHDKLDDEIKENIETCLLLLEGVGIRKLDLSDRLILKACELYCKWQFDYDGKGERFEQAYSGLRDFLSLGGDYTAGDE